MLLTFVQHTQHLSIFCFLSSKLLSIHSPIVLHKHLSSSEITIFTSPHSLGLTHLDISLCMFPVYFYVFWVLFGALKNKMFLTFD